MKYDSNKKQFKNIKAMSNSPKHNYSKDKILRNIDKSISSTGTNSRILDDFRVHLEIPYAFKASHRKFRNLNDTGNLDIFLIENVLEETTAQKIANIDSYLNMLFKRKNKKD